MSSVEERLIAIERHLERLEVRLGHIEASLGAWHKSESEHQAAVNDIKAALAGLQGREIERTRLGRLGLVLLPLMLGVAALFGAVLNKLGMRW